MPNCGDTKGCSDIEYGEYAHLVLFAEMSVRHFTMCHNSRVISTAAMLGTMTMLPIVLPQVLPQVLPHSSAYAVVPTE